MFKACRWWSVIVFFSETRCCPLDTLKVGRSNLGTSLRELQNWNIVKIVHKLGDRRDHFQTTTDVWNLFVTILDERKRREIDPTVAVLNECAAELDDSDAYTHERMTKLLDLVATMTAAYGQLRKIPPKRLRSVVKMSNKLQGLPGK